MPFSLNDLSGYRFDPQRVDSAALGDFRNEAGVFALISFGGTISSVKGDGPGGIKATLDNKALDLITRLKKSGLIKTEYTGISLLAKDSREVTAEEVGHLLDFLNFISNTRVLITCGTYLLPEFTRAAASYVLSPKIVGFTGSMKIETEAGSDAEANLGGALSAVNALVASGVKAPLVFASFHGEFYSGTALDALNLHPEKN